MRTCKVIDRSWNKLFRKVKSYDIGLFIGAGLSIDNKMPSWTELTAALAEGRVHQEIPLTSHLGVAQDAVVRANGPEEWIERVRRCLYSGFYEQLRKSGLSASLLRDLENHKVRSRTVREFCQDMNPALAEVVRMCSLLGKEDKIPRIVTVLTTNYDSLLQVFDRAMNGSPRRLRTIERATKESKTNKTSLYHLHGFLTPHPNTKPRKEAADRLVLTETEYTRRNDDPNHWAATTLHWALRECPVVFIGCSMSDELTRRALYRTRDHRIVDADAERSRRRLKRHSKPKHYAVCPWPEDAETADAITKSYALMDVNPLWIRDFSKECGELTCRLKQLRKRIAKYA